MRSSAKRRPVPATPPDLERYGRFVYSPRVSDSLATQPYLLQHWSAVAGRTLARLDAAQGLVTFDYPDDDPARPTAAKKGDDLCAMPGCMRKRSRWRRICRHHHDGAGKAARVAMGR